MKKLTKREKFLIYILACFLIATAGIYLLLLPAYEKYATIRDQYREAQSTQVSMEAAINSIPDLETALENAKLSVLNLEAPYSSPMTNEALDQLVTGLCLNYSLSPQVLSIQSNGLDNLPMFEAYVSDESDEDSSIFDTDTSEEVTEETIQDEAEDITTADTTADTTDSGVETLIGVVEVELLGSQDNFNRLMDAVSSRQDMVITYFKVEPDASQDQTISSGTTTTDITYSNWSQSLDGGAAKIEVRFNIYMVEKTQS
jgi:hypothetical protein